MVVKCPGGNERGEGLGPTNSFTIPHGGCIRRQELNFLLSINLKIPPAGYIVIRAGVEKVAKVVYGAIQKKESLI